MWIFPRPYNFFEDSHLFRTGYIFRFLQFFPETIRIVFAKYS